MNNKGGEAAAAVQNWQFPVAIAGAIYVVVAAIISMATGDWAGGPLGALVLLGPLYASLAIGILVRPWFSQQSQVRQHLIAFGLLAFVVTGLAEALSWAVVNTFDRITSAQGQSVLDSRSGGRR